MEILPALIIAIALIAQTIILLDKIMATEAELTNLIKAQTDRLVDIGAAVLKVGMETDATLAELRRLKAVIEAGGVASPELEAAVHSLEAQAGILKNAVDAVDEKIPDAPPP